MKAEIKTRTKPIWLFMGLRGVQYAVCITVALWAAVWAFCILLDWGWHYLHADNGTSGSVYYANVFKRCSAVSK